LTFVRGGVPAVVEVLGSRPGPGLACMGGDGSVPPGRAPVLGRVGSTRSFGGPPDVRSVASPSGVGMPRARMSSGSWVVSSWKFPLFLFAGVRSSRRLMMVRGGSVCR
jgi:hypothetical protein